MRLLAALGIALLPLVSLAQALDPFGSGLGNIGGDEFSLTVTPPYPQPYSEARVSVLSGALDLSATTLTATVGGKEIYKGSVRPFSVPLGKAGSVTNVSVTLTSGTLTYNKSLSLVPQDVVLIAEPLSSVPPLYPGKGLVPLEGEVRIVAVASLSGVGSTLTDPASYAYSWTVDGVWLGNASGIGKSVIIVDTPLLYRAREVSVVVTSADGKTVGGAALSLVGTQPFVRLYAYDPLLGIRYDRALTGSYALEGAEATLYAAPFALPSRGATPALTWFLNGSAAQEGNSITLRPTGRGEGRASLSFTASSGESTASAELSIIFGEQPDTNFFGL